MHFLKKKILYVTAPVIFFVLLYAGVFIYVANNVYNDNNVKSDAIIVLGARAKVGDKIGTCLKARTDHAITLYKKGYAARLIFSGGENQAETMNSIAKSNDVSSKNILLENTAKSTYENLFNSQKIMQKNHLQSAIIVTDPYHEVRASLVADKLHMQHTLSPAMDSPCWIPKKFLSVYFLREPLAIIVYKLMGRL